MYFSFSLNPFAQGLLLSTLSNMKIKEQGEKKRGKIFLMILKRKSRKWQQVTNRRKSQEVRWWRRGRKGEHVERSGVLVQEWTCLHPPQQHLWGTDSPCSHPGSKWQFHPLQLPALGADWRGEVRQGLEAGGLWQMPEPGQLQVSGSWLSRFLPGELKWKAAAGYSWGWEVRRKQASRRGAAWSWK